MENAQTIPKRDISLDVLKGAGCLLMIVAHSSLSLRGYKPFSFYAGLAPALFFAVSGVTAGFQTQRHSARGVLFTYLFLFLAGFSFNRITDAGFLEEVNFDLLQIIAIGSSVVYLLEYYVRPGVWVYLLLALMSFAAKFALLALLGDNVIYGISGIFVPPGIFPIFPWLFLFFLGIFAYRTRNFYNLLLCGLGAGLYFLLAARGVELDLENKWNMSPGYFIMCFSLVLGSFFLVRAIPIFRQRFGMAPPVFLGTSSLLFLYVHFPIILYLKEHNVQRKVLIINQHPYLFWLLVLALTILFLLLLLWIAKIKWIARPFQHLPTWIVLTALVFAVGLLVRIDLVVYWVEIGLGILVAMYYPLLTNMLKQPIAARSQQGTS